MGSDDIARLRRIRHLREERAAARLAQAQAALRSADAAARAAADAQACHETARAAAEPRIYGALLEGPVSARRIQWDAAELSALATGSVAHQAAVVEATQQHRAEAARTADAASGRRRAAAEREAAEALWTAVSRRAAIAGEVREERAQEDLVAKRSLP